MASYALHGRLNPVLHTGDPSLLYCIIVMCFEGGDARNMGWFAKIMHLCLPTFTFGTAISLSLAKNSNGKHYSELIISKY